VMYAGRIVEEGRTDALVSHPVHPYTHALLACIPELGRPNKPLAPIPGQPPPLNALPAGCHFAPRCDYAQEKCRTDNIDLRRLGDQRMVRCIRAEELTPWPC
jgi:peptide/nickel transport system permease protein